MVNSATPARRPVGVIDLGSNTVLLLVLDAEGRVLRDEGRITRLSEGVFSSGVLSPRARTRTRKVVHGLVQLARAVGVERVVGVGTEALRRARDGRGLLAELCELGLLHEAYLLDPQQEAEFALAASQRERSPGDAPLWVIDVGGGSTELAWSEDEGRVHGTSLPLGAVRLTEAYVTTHPIPACELVVLRGAVSRATASLAGECPQGLPGDADVVAVAGTATTLAALELRLDPYLPAAVEGFPIERELLLRWIAKLSQMSVDERRRLPGLEPGRADVIVTGLLILDGVLARLGAERFRVSGRGVRYGVAFRLLEGKSLV